MLLAGGRQTRLPNVSIPKALLNVEGVRVGDISLRQLVQRSGEVFVMGGQRATELDNAWGSSARVLVDPGYGTGLALYIAALASTREILLIANADTLTTVDLPAMIAEHSRFSADGMIALTRWTQDTQNPGMFAVASTGHVRRSYEDGRAGSPPLPGAAWHGASTGTMLLPRKSVLQIAEIYGRPDLSIERDILPEFIRRGALRAFDAGNALSLDLGVPHRLTRARNYRRTIGGLLVPEATIISYPPVVTPIQVLATNNCALRRLGDRKFIDR